MIEYARQSIHSLEEGFKPTQWAISCMESWKSVPIWACGWRCDRPHHRRRIQRTDNSFRLSGDGQGSIMRCLWIRVPRMRWIPPTFILGGMRKLPGLIAPRDSDPLRANNSVVYESFQRLFSSLTLCIRFWKRLLAPVQQWYTTARPQSTLFTDFVHSRPQRSWKLSPSYWPRPHLHAPPTLMR